MLKTSHRENLLFEACLKSKQKFVIDKTNLTRETREKYITESKRFGFRVIGYYFQADLKKAIERNNQRTGKAQVPEKAISGAFNRLQIPQFDEGFDELFYVSINKANEFIIADWVNEI